MRIGPVRWRKGKWKYEPYTEDCTVMYIHMNSWLSSNVMCHAWENAPASFSVPLFPVAGLLHRCLVLELREAEADEGVDGLSQGERTQQLVWNEHLHTAPGQRQQPVRASVVRGPSPLRTDGGTRRTGEGARDNQRGSGPSLRRRRRSGAAWRPTRRGARASSGRVARCVQCEIHKRSWKYWQLPGPMLPRSFSIEILVFFYVYIFCGFYSIWNNRVTLSLKKHLLNPVQRRKQQTLLSLYHVIIFLSSCFSSLFYLFLFLFCVFQLLLPIWQSSIDVVCVTFFLFPVSSWFLSTDLSTIWSPHLFDTTSDL